MKRKNFKTDFKPFRVGSIFNPVSESVTQINSANRKIVISYPSRLNAMAIDPSKIAKNENLVYTPGEVIFKVNICNKVMVTKVSSTNEIEISTRSRRVPLINHAAQLMKKALNIEDGLKISVDNSGEIRHAGLGSSSRLIASVACAINELYDNPISPGALVQYLAQNHGEEIDGQTDLINPVQCIGGSAAAGLFKGAMIILAGESRVVASMDIKDAFSVVIGIPEDFIELDSKVLLEKEIACFDKFIRTGEKYGKVIAYRILHQVLPAMVEGDLKTIGDLIYDYRYNMGSIENCSYTYQGLVSLTNKLANLKTDNKTPVISISSVGPGIFAITTDAAECKKVFRQAGLVVYLAELQNERYKVVLKE